MHKCRRPAASTVMRPSVALVSQTVVLHPQCARSAMPGHKAVRGHELEGIVQIDSDLHLSQWDQQGC